MAVSPAEANRKRKTRQSAAFKDAIKRIDQGLTEGSRTEAR